MNKCNSYGSMTIVVKYMQIMNYLSFDIKVSSGMYVMYRVQQLAFLGRVDYDTCIERSK